MLLDSKFHVTFRHTNLLSREIFAAKCDNGYTVCEINYKGTPFIGQSVCSTSDQFNKAIGRKVAFGRALLSTPMNKHERKQLWESYFSKCRKK
jgi:hypothetical protein